MAFNFATGEYDANGPDLSSTVTDSVGYGYVQPDNSQGAPSMAPATPTGNGSGYYVDQQEQNQLFDTLKMGLNYAMQKDQQQMQYNMVGQQTQSQAVRQQQVKQKQGSLFLLIGLGALVFLLVEERK